MRYTVECKSPLTLAVRGVHHTKVIPIVVFHKRNDLALEPGHWNQWFLSSFDSKSAMFWAVSGV